MNSTSITRNRYKSYQTGRRRRLALVLSGLTTVGFSLYFVPSSGTLLYSIVLFALGVAIIFFPLTDEWPTNPMRQSYYGDWLKLPTLETYWEQNPNTKTSSGPSCKKCGSKRLRNWGLAGKHDGDRLVSCHACGEDLYRI